MTLVPVYDATLFCYGIFVFRCHQEVFDCFAPSKVDLYAMLLTYVFEAFTEASCVCYCYVISSDVGLVFVVCSIIILVVSLVLQEK